MTLKKLTLGIITVQNDIQEGNIQEDATSKLKVKTAQKVQSKVDDQTGMTLNLIIRKQ